MTCTRMHPDDQLDLGPLEALPVERAPAPSTTGRSSSAATSGSAPAASAVPVLSGPEYRLCHAIQHHPLEPSSRYARWAGMSPKTAIKLRQVLIEAQLIRPRRVERSARGGGALLLELTAAGEQALAACERHQAGPTSPATETPDAR